MLMVWIFFIYVPTDILLGQTDEVFEDLLRSHGIHEHTIIILKHHGITDTNTLRDLEVLLREVVQKLNNMTEGTFWCLFKCLGGIGAVGLGGILALVGLVYALPVAGFTAAGITAGSLAVKIMSLYGGYVPAGSLFATFQSLGAAVYGRRHNRTLINVKS